MEMGRPKDYFAPARRFAGVADNTEPKYTICDKGSQFWR